MASGESLVLNMKELSLNSETQTYVMLVPDKIFTQCFEDTSGVMADIVFKKIEEMYTVNGLPKVKTLDYVESLKILTELRLLNSIVDMAKQAEHITVGVKTKFDQISVNAYSKNMPDETLTAFATMAPADMNAQQNVRFMEIVASSMQEQQTEGKTVLDIVKGFKINYLKSKEKYCPNYLGFVLCRLCIRHSYLTHSHLLKEGQVPQCVHCFTDLTVEHIFVDCVDCRLCSYRKLIFQCSNHA